MNTNIYNHSDIYHQILQDYEKNPGLFGISSENFVFSFFSFCLQVFLGRLSLIYHPNFSSSVAPTTFNYHLINAASRPIRCVYKPARNLE
jgi:hypothetical protein